MEKHSKEFFDLYERATPDEPVNTLNIDTVPSGVGEGRTELLKGYYNLI